MTNKTASTQSEQLESQTLPSLVTSKQKIRQMLEIAPLSSNELDTAKIIHPGMRDIRILNSFRALRNKLLLQAGKNNFTLMVSSISTGGGATYISENLAAAIALDFEKTSLLIDCNISEPSASKLALNLDFGLTDYLDELSLNVSDIIYATGIPRMRVIPNGNTTSIGSELLTSDRMEEFIEEVKSRYPERYVILDAPAINSSPDARVLADICDYTLLVVPYGKVTKLQITAAINSVPSNKLVGVVFNN